MAIQKEIKVPINTNKMLTFMDTAMKELDRQHMSPVEMIAALNFLRYFIKETACFTNLNMKEMEEQVHDMYIQVTQFTKTDPDYCQ